MKGSRMMATVLAVTMLGAAALAEVVRPTVKIADQGPRLQLEQMFPPSFGGWRVDTSIPVILPAPDVQAKLDKIYNQVLSRTYVDEQGHRIMLSVAYGGDQSDGTSAHKPEVCYPAQGFQILANRKTRVPIDGQEIPARQLMSKLGARYEPITYWIVVGDRAVTSATEQKLAQLRFGVRGLIPDGMLVRVSSIDRDEQRGLEIQHRFIVDLARAMSPADRARAFGAPGGPERVAQVEHR